MPFRPSLLILTRASLLAGAAFLIACSDESFPPPPVGPDPGPAEWHWMAPVAEGASLSDVWGPSADNLFATATGGVVMRYDGTSWRKTTTPTTESLNGIWGTSANHAVAVGDNGVVMVFNGTSWSQQASGIDVYLLDVWGTSPSDVFAVGLDRTVLHYNGVQWSAMTTLKFGPALNGVWGSSTSNIYATGLGRDLFNYDGASWNAEATPATFALSAIWGSGPSDIIAVGGNGAAIRFDGTEWSAIDAPSTGGFLFFSSVWGVSSTEVYAAGLTGRVYRWDGSVWNPMTSRSTQNLDGVYGVDGRVFAVGQVGTMLELTAGEWQYDDQGLTVDLQDVWVDAAGDAFAVGDNGTILRLQDGVWQRMESGTTHGLRSLHGTSSSDLIAVGRGGTVLRFDGASWTSSIEGPGYDLHDVYVLATGEAYAVGAGGLILRSQGGPWIDASIPSATDSLLSVWGPAPDNVYVVGAQSRAFRWTGLQWKLVSIDLARVNNYHAVYGTASNDVYVGAEYLYGTSAASPSEAPLHAGGLIYYWNGTSWTIPYQDPLHDVLSIWTASADEVFAAGDAASILVGSSEGFQRITDLNNLPFRVNAAYGASASDVLVVGDDGAIVRYSR